MSQEMRVLWREIIGALMCSSMYFDLRLDERLTLVRSLCDQHGPWPR